MQALWQITYSHLPFATNYFWLHPYSPAELLSFGEYLSNYTEFNLPSQ